MSKTIIEFEKSQEKKSLPSVQVGDTINVSKVIIEGKKKRIQKFEGTVVKLQGSSSRRSVTIRKIIGGVGVEKSFLLHSPLLSDIKTIRRSKVRRAKLYYLRDRIGAKANRLKARD
jgi:large subunit ribosomal protein L19